MAPLQQSKGGGSGSFLLRADDGNRYWCKTLNNFQHGRVPTNEQIVGRLGQLIDAPVCEPQLVYLPDALAGWEFKAGGGRQVEVGWAHGSRAAELAVETRQLDNRAMDENARRHAGIVALYDWAGGSDAQWLMVGTDSAFVSHDHGHFFPGGAGWTVQSLQLGQGAHHQLPFPNSGLDASELNRLADRIDAVTEEEVVECAANIPAEWPVQDDELDALVEYLCARRAAVAQRLRDIVGAL